MLQVLAPFQLVRAILERREAIRYLRDQRGDDRCFLDRYTIWEYVISTRPMPRFTAEEGMRHCVDFYNHSRTASPDAVPEGAACEIARWDANLPRAPHAELVAELLMLQRAIVAHRDVEAREGRLRTCNDDRTLILAALPENTSCDFRLPPQEKFLVSTTERSGCPAFWLSHSRCASQCNLHQWGPCT